MDKNGSPLFRIKQQRTAIALILPVERISRKSLAQIESSLTEILQEAAEIHPLSRQSIDVGDITATQHLEFVMP